MRKFIKILQAAVSVLPVVALVAIPAVVVFAAKTVKTAGPSVEELLEQGRAAFLAYDFDKAEQDFASARKKAGKNIPDELEIYEEELINARNFMDRVEQLVILDSITVSKEDFFKAYRLPSSAGSLGTAKDVPFPNVDTDYVFTNEGNDFKMWAQPDTLGVLRIVESIRLTDGSWSEPAETPDVLNNGGDAEYPFMMSDGVTLYYASDNEESMGGYDIFVATRDAADGSYLQPQNIGMPYNSPYDDYLLAIDELNGVGWWATDRNQLGDMLTIYLYKLNDIRKNYNADDTEDLADKAFIRDYRATWGDEDYSRLVSEVMSINPAPAKKRIDFIFPVKGGKIYSNLDDFKSSAGRSMMIKYLEADRAFKNKEEKLSSLRKKYAVSKSSSLKSTISSLEKETEKEREALIKLRSEVYRAEFDR